MQERNISLIILNYNSADETKKCVDQLLKLNAEIHLVIVDNSSSDNSYKELNEYYAGEKVDLIETDYNGGYSYGNNLGILYAWEKYGSNIMGIVNPDVMILNVDVIYALYEALQTDEKYAVAGACAIDINNRLNLRCSTWKIPTAMGIWQDYLLIKNREKQAVTLKMRTDSIAEVDCVAGCFFMFKTEIMKKIGCLDTNLFLYNEENLLGIKLKKEGYKEILVVNQTYHHNHTFERKERKLIEKIRSQKYPYASRRYLCKNYYPVYTRIFLDLALVINEIQIIFGYFKNLLLKRKGE